VPWGTGVPPLLTPTPTPLQPNLAIARVRPLNKVIEVGNSRLRFGGGEKFAASSTLN
jgi:hypothetical protein